MIKNVRACDLLTNSALPPHLKETTTVEEIFSQCVDLRWVPTKVFLRLLAEYTSDTQEKETLLFLCSREGSNEYIKRMVAVVPTIMDILYS